MYIYSLNSITDDPICVRRHSRANSRIYGLGASFTPRYDPHEDIIVEHRSSWIPTAGILASNVQDSSADHVVSDLRRRRCRRSVKVTLSAYFPANGIDGYVTEDVRTPATLLLIKKYADNYTHYRNCNGNGNVYFGALALYLNMI